MPRNHDTSRLAIIPIGPSIAYLPLTKGQFALIDSDVAALAEKHLWHAQWSPAPKTFYATRALYNSPDGRKVQSLHVFVIGYKSGFTVDHIIPRNGLDCRRINLRHATHQQQCFNRRLRVDNASGYKGVHLRKSKGTYIASIRHNGKLIHLGDFQTKEEAHSVRVAKAKELQGEFERTE